MTAPRVSIATILREWGRIGCVGYGGPPAHIALLRELCVARKGWMDDGEFEHAIAVCNLLPGPASTQLAIYCAWRLRGPAGALVGALGFILPGLVAILALAMVFTGSPPLTLRGIAAGAGAVVAAVALQAAFGLIPGSLRQASRPAALDWRQPRVAQIRWTFYVIAGTVATVRWGVGLVFVLVACGLVESIARCALPARSGVAGIALPWPLAFVAAGGIGSLCWMALKVGALSYGGGFVIIPLMESDAVGRYAWMTSGEFLGAVALGQATPGPVVLTVAVVGYAAYGLGGALVATFVAFAPSFALVALGAPHFERLRKSPVPRAFLAGSGPAAIGAILGSALVLAGALTEPWQYAILALGAIGLLVLRRGVLETLLLAAAIGATLALAGVPIPR